MQSFLDLGHDVYVVSPQGLVITDSGLGQLFQRIVQPLTHILALDCYFHVFQIHAY